MIAIIGILVSLLLPAVFKALESGREASCRANLKQCHAMANVYASDNEGKLPWASNSTPGRGISPNLFFFLYYRASDDGAKALVCPSAAYQGKNPWGGPMRSIGANTFVMPYDYQNGGTDEDFVQPQVRLSDISRPVEVVLFGDCAQFSPPNARVIPYMTAWYLRNSHFLASNANNPVDDRTVPQTGFWDDLPLIPLRHAGYANLVNIDGSIRSINHISQLKERNLTVNY